MGSSTVSKTGRPRLNDEEIKVTVVFDGYDGPAFLEHGRRHPDNVEKVWEGKATTRSQTLDVSGLKSGPGDFVPHCVTSAPSACKSRSLGGHCGFRHARGHARVTVNSFFNLTSHDPPKSLPKAHATHLRSRRSLADFIHPSDDILRAHVSPPPWWCHRGDPCLPPFGGDVTRLS